jgi:hypothetical protein
LTLTADQPKKLGTRCEKTATAFFDATLDTALQCVGLSKGGVANDDAYPGKLRKK